MDVKINPKRVLKFDPKTYPKMNPKMHPQTTIGPGVHFRLPGQVPQNPSRMAISTGFQLSLGHLLEIYLVQVVIFSLLARGTKSRPPK
jgi:hypothetical protein